MANPFKGRTLNKALYGSQPKLTKITSPNSAAFYVNVFNMGINLILY